MAEKRQAVHAYLTPEAKARYEDFAAEHGISVSSLIEVMGRMLGRGDEGGPIGVDGVVMPPVDRKLVDATVQAARKVDAQRRRRKEAVA